MDFGSPPRRPRAESVVPMINVVFLLLVFFLMTATIAPPDPFASVPPDPFASAARGPGIRGARTGRNALPRRERRAGLRRPPGRRRAGGRALRGAGGRQGRRGASGGEPRPRPRAARGGRGDRGAARDGAAMRLSAEIPVCLGLAAGLHLALVSGWSGGAPDGAGSGGAALVTLAGQVGAVQALVTAWETPPQAMAQTAPPPPPAMSDVPGAPVVAADPPRPEAPGAALLAVPDGTGAAPSPPGPPPAPARLATPDAPAARPPPRAETVPPMPTGAAPAPRAPAPDRPAPAASAAAPAPDSAPPAPPLRPAARPEDQPEAPSQARPRQAAAGAGSGNARGTRGTADTALSESQRAGLVAAWGAEIRARIEARKVPPAVRASGRSVLRITVARSGRSRRCGSCRARASPRSTRPPSTPCGAPAGFLRRRPGSTSRGSRSTCPSSIRLTESSSRTG
jgi:periplasmic protein TonB